MREILFRGKRKIGGEWVEGGLGCCEARTFIIKISETQPRRIEGIEVIPKTVGQYTGLIDKNGKKIFEGDIVASNELPYSTMAVVGFDEITGGWEPFVPYEDFGCCESVCSLHCEVIGNIHDNPELLKGE